MILLTTNSSAEGRQNNGYLCLEVAAGGHDEDGVDEAAEAAKPDAPGAALGVPLVGEEDAEGPPHQRKGKGHQEHVLRHLPLH